VRVAANGWYRRSGFVESFRYMHVYLGDGDDRSGFFTPERLSSPVIAFLYGKIEDEAAIRFLYRRAYGCRQYVRAIDASSSARDPRR